MIALNKQSKSRGKVRKAIQQARQMSQITINAVLWQIIRQQAEAEAREADVQHLRQQLLDKLIEANPFDPPQSLVEQELDRRVEELARSFADRGLDPQGSGIDWQAVREKQRESTLQGIFVSLSTYV